MTGTPKSARESAGLSGPGSDVQLEEATLKALFDPLPIGIMLLNHRDRSLLFSNRFYDAVPRKQQPVILAEIFNHVDKRSAGRLPININQEMEIQRDGARLRLGYTVYPIKPDIILVFFSEIASKSIHLESKLDNEFYDRMSELVAEMAHEIGNPLSGINTILEVILENIALWPVEKVSDYLQRTIKEIRRLATFLNRIRDMSNENELDIKPRKLVDLVTRLQLQNEETLRKKRITFKNRIPEDILVRVDADAFQQILLNLLNNSLQILKSGKTIDLSVESSDQYYTRMIYANNGKTIPADDLERIFSPFFSTRPRGSGIGLAVSRRLITRMGGTMRAENADQGSGVRFVIHIPSQVTR